MNIVIRGGGDVFNNIRIFLIAYIFLRSRRLFHSAIVPFESHWPSRRDSVAAAAF